MTDKEIIEHFKAFDIFTYGMNIPIQIPIVGGYIERKTVRAIMESVTKRVENMLMAKGLLEPDEEFK